MTREPKQRNKSSWKFLSTGPEAGEVEDERVCRRGRVDIMWPAPFYARDYPHPSKVRTVKRSQAPIWAIFDSLNCRIAGENNSVLFLVQ
jgi:hypothetical protein